MVVPLAPCCRRRASTLISHYRAEKQEPRTKNQEPRIRRGAAIVCHRAGKKRPDVTDPWIVRPTPISSSSKRQGGSNVLSEKTRRTEAIGSGHGSRDVFLRPRTRVPATTSARANRTNREWIRPRRRRPAVHLSADRSRPAQRRRRTAQPTGRD